MTDVLLVIALVASFAALAGFVAVCARIIGPDPEGAALSAGLVTFADDAETEDTVEVPA
jgi:hypothetical protein